VTPEHNKLKNWRGTVGHQPSLQKAEELVPLHHLEAEDEDQ